jgi:hypothetical protein
MFTNQRNEIDLNGTMKFDPHEAALVGRSPVEVMNHALPVIQCHQYPDKREELMFPGIHPGGTLAQEGWQLELESGRGSETPGVSDVSLRVTCLQELSDPVSAGLRFELGNWSGDNYVFAPGMVYAGNRFRVLPHTYPVQFFADERASDPHRPVTMTETARLRLGEGESSLALSSGDVATPCIGFFDPVRKRGVLVFTPQGEWSGSYSYTLAESDDRNRAELIISCPVVREGRIASGLPTGEQGVRLRKNEEIRLQLQTHEFPADSIKAFIAYFCKHRKSLARHNRGPSVFPFGAARNCIEARYIAKNWNPEGYIGMNIEQDGGGRFSFLAQWQTGWCYGGLQLPTFAALGQEISRKRTWQTLDWIFRELQTEGGFFYAGRGNNRFTGDNWAMQGDDPNVLLIRRQGDMIHSVIKTLETMEDAGYADLIKPEWVQGIRRGCDAVVRLWQKHGRLGQFIHIGREEILVAGSTSGASAVLGLAEAGARLKEPVYLETAAAIGRYFDEVFLQKGFTCGGPGEAGQAPDSESIFALLEGYWALYAATREAEWLMLACEAADLFTTWVVSHDFRFPENSFFDRVDIRAAGTVIANTQNRHSAPGICTASGDVLLKLYRATGKQRYLELARDISSSITQFISREECLFPRQEISWVNERVNISDWEGRHLVGDMTFRGTCWCESSCLLTTLDFPGIYVERDSGTVTCFDHVNADWIEEDGRKRLLIHNPTSHDTVVTILSEGRQERERAYRFGLLKGARRIELKAGERKMIDQLEA